MFFSLSCPEAVILDLDNTLYDYNRAHQRALGALKKSFVKKVGLAPGQFQHRYQFARRTVKRRLEGTAASHSRLLYIKVMLDRLAINQPRLTLQLESVYWQAFFKQIRLYADVLPFLSLMQKENIPVIILSDLTLRVQLLKLAHLKIKKQIRFILTSEETGSEKPTKRNFQQAAGMCKVRPKDTWVIGDERKRDLQGALNFGAQPILVDRRTHKRSCFRKMYLEVNSFRSLLNLYKQVKSR